MLELTPQLTRSDDAPRGLSSLAQSLPGSAILKIAYEVRDLVERGRDILNLTVGDFDSREFPVPEELSSGIRKALEEGHTNYPPSNGEKPLREAVVELFEKRLGLKYPIESVLITGGSRPLIAGLYLALIDANEHVVYGTPSWNNHYYSKLVRATPVEVATQEASRFFPSAEAITPHLSRARLVCLNSPQNPTGTMIPANELRKIAQAIVEENARRTADRRAPVYLMYDQVYWLLTFGGQRHENPVSLVPEVAPYTVFVDGISKGFAATGLRVGWGVGPPEVIDRMNALSTHLGSWAPKPEQRATAQWLRNERAVDAYLSKMTQALHARLAKLEAAVRGLEQRGHPVGCIAPEGAIYLSMKLDLRGGRTAAGDELRTDDDVRKYLLHEAGIAVVPFGCFGVRDDSGWFRASVGAISEAACATLETRLERALALLR